MGVSDFDTFWASFPRRTGKLDAIKAYARARTIASAAEILAGVEHYKRNKPDYADWCHPSTFLNKGRWMDEEDAQPVRVVKYPDCDHTPRCPSKLWCQVLRDKEKAS